MSCRARTGLRFLTWRFAADAAAGADAAGPAQPCWCWREPAAAAAGTGARKSRGSRRRVRRCSSSDWRGCLRAERERLLLELVRGTIATVLSASLERRGGRASVAGAWPRFADGGRAAQPAGCGDRLAAAGDAAVRLSDARVRWRFGCRATWLVESTARCGEPCVVPSARGRADSDCGDELPLSGRRGYAGGAVGSAATWERRDQRVPVRSGLGCGRAVRP